MKKPQLPCFSRAKHRELATNAGWPLAALRLSLFLMAFLLGITGAQAQTDSTATGDPDLEVQVPCLYQELNTDILSNPQLVGLPFVAQAELIAASNYNDWFDNTTTGILGIIETASLVFPPPGSNLTWEADMKLLPSLPNLLDAVAARDYHSANNELDQTMFNGGSDKNGANTNTWTPGIGSVPQKNDIIDVGGHIRFNPMGGMNHLVAYAFATTRNTSGDANLDFEIFAGNLQRSGSQFINGGPDAGHTALRQRFVGGHWILDQESDILVSIDYGNGGTTACAAIWLWVDPNNLQAPGQPVRTIADHNAHVNANCTGTPDFTYIFSGEFFSGTGAGPFGYARILPCDFAATGINDFIHASVNNASVPALPAWGSLSGQNAISTGLVEPLQLAEVVVDFTALGLIPNNLSVSNPCDNLFGTLLVKTRASGSITAQLKDFAGPYQFGVIFQPPSITCPPDITVSCVEDVPAGAGSFSEFLSAGGTITFPPQSTPLQDISYTDGPLTPDGCGGQIERVYTINDSCGNTLTCTQIITVDDTEAPTGTFPNDQSYPNTCFSNRPSAPAPTTIASGYTDNCSAVSVSLINTLTNGNDCGWSVAYTYKIEDLCGNFITRTLTYSGSDTQAPTGTFPNDQTFPNVCFANIPSAPSPASIAQGYTDNCNTVIVSLINTVTTGNDCSWSVAYTYKIEDICGNFITRTLTYSGSDTQAPTVSCNVPGGVITVCEGSTINYPTPSATDNCSPTNLINIACSPANAVPAPGTSVTVTCTATDQCGNSSDCSYSIRVVRNPSCSIIVPSTKPLPNSCNNTITANVNGLDGATTYNWTVVGGAGWSIQSSNGASATYCAGTGSALICLEVKNIVNGVECVSTCCDTVECQKKVECTYTQGYYGNAGGNNCTGGNTTALLNILLGPPNGNLIIGNCDCPTPGTNRCLTLTLADVGNGCIYRRLPGGGPPASINAGVDGDPNICTAAPGIPQKGNGSFRNVLVAQTITLGLNLRIPGSSLGSLQITDQYLVTQEADGNGCSDPAATPVPNTESVHIIPQAVIDYLGTDNTVQDLFELANLAISGCLPAGAPSLSTINQAVSAFNEGFDECRFLVGFQDTNPLDTTSSTTSSRTFSIVGDVSMESYPNPANESTQIEFVLNGFDSEAALEVFTLQGVRIATLFNAPAEADVAYRTRFDVTHLPSGLYIYQLTTSKGVLKDKITVIR